MIRFNIPYICGREIDYINDTLNIGRLSGNGKYTQYCHDFFKKQYGFNKVLLTTSCTDALEMAAILIDIKPGDEVIIPSFTFVSTANAFLLRGAKIIFCDSEDKTPNIDANKIEELITNKTKAIVPVHYAGISCDMDKIMEIADKYNLMVIEDAAQAIDSYYNNRPLGSIGHLATFSFHATKNIISGEGGMLVINDKQFEDRAEIIWEKGTNRSAFFKGDIDKYGWVDIGSSFLPSELTSAFLFAQLEAINDIQDKRKSIWNTYHNTILETTIFKKMFIPDGRTNNAHMYYLLFKDETLRDKFLIEAKKININAVFHYLSLHSSEYFKVKHDITRDLQNCNRYANTIVRLPLYVEMQKEEIKMVCNLINEFSKANTN